MLQDEGYHTLACIAVNDPFVMAAWGKSVDPDKKVSQCHFYESESNLCTDYTRCCIYSVYCLLLVILLLL